MDVVFHVTSGNRASVASAFGNVRNLLDDDSVDVNGVDVVTNGAAVGHLGADGDLDGDVRALLNRGVEIAACANSLDSRGESAEDLVDGVGVVPSAMGALVSLQAEGYAYVRP